MSINSASGARVGSEPSSLPGSLLRSSDLVMLGKPSLNRSNPDCAPTPSNCLSKLRCAGVGNPKASRSAFGQRWPSPGYVGLVIPNVHRLSPNTTGCVPAPGNCLRGSGVRGNCNPCLAHFGLAPFGGSSRLRGFRVRIDDIQADRSRVDRDILAYPVWFHVHLQR